MALPMIDPAAAAASQPPESTPAPAEPASGGEPAEQSTQGIPKPVLALPAFQALLVGQPAAVSAPLAEFEKRPEAKLLLEHKDALLKAGFSLYRSLAGDTGVVFNTFHMHPDELQAADKAGQLQQVAPPFDAVNAAVAKSGAQHPILAATAHPMGPKGPPMPTPPQSQTPATLAAQVSAAPAPASVQNKLSTARTQNLAAGSPTSGPSPGAGRLLNSILKPVV